jgi:hypothetical protein
VTPLGRLRLGLRVARRRRKGFAVLRRMRTALAAALVLHIERSVGPRPYSSQYDAIYAMYRAAFVQLRKRFPRLDIGDPRGLP